MLLAELVSADVVRDTRMAAPKSPGQGEQIDLTSERIHGTCTLLAIAK